MTQSLAAVAYRVADADSAIESFRDAFAIRLGEKAAP